MEAQNKKERRTSIVKFGVLFATTIVLILGAAYFDFNQMPLKENKVLKSKIASIEKERIYQKKFSEKAAKVRALIDSLDTPGNRMQYFNALINSNIVELQKTIPAKDSTANYEMYVNAVQSYLDIQELKTKLINFDGVDEKLINYREELDRMTSKYNECQRYLSAMQRR